MKDLFSQNIKNSSKNTAIKAGSYPESWKLSSAEKEALMQESDAALAIFRTANDSK